jgi:hypothetical protein
MFAASATLPIEQTMAAENISEFRKRVVIEASHKNCIAVMRKQDE